MELIYTDANGVEQGFLPKSINADFDIGETYDFELVTTETSLLEIGAKIYSPGTEFGGIIKRISHDTETGEIKYGGYTWRGLFTKKILQPAAGEDFRIVTGKPSKIILDFLIEFGLHSIFNIATYGNTITYQFDRYCTFYDGIVKMLMSLGKKLSFSYNIITGKVDISIEDIVDWSELEDFSQDSNVNMRILKRLDCVNHLICLGKGDLKDRTVIHLYLQEDGSIGQTPFFTGAEEITETYDASSSADEELLENGKNEFSERIKGNEIEISLKNNSNYGLYDIVQGVDYVTGISVKIRIVDIIFKIEKGVLSKSYKVEEYNL